MTIQHRLLIYNNRFFFSLLLLILPLFGIQAAAQDTSQPPGPDLYLYVTQDGLTLQVVYSQPISLAGFQLSVNRDGKIEKISLARFGILALTEYVAQPGACYFIPAAADAEAPAACTQRNLTFAAPVVKPGDKFWYNTSGERLDIAIFRDDQSINQFCPSLLNECPIYYFTEEPESSFAVETPNTPVVSNPESPLVPGEFPFATLQSNRGEINQIIWSRDGSFLVSAQDNGDICLWRTNQPAVITPITCESAHRDGVTALAWNPDLVEQSFVSVGADGLIHLWRIEFKNTASSSVLVTPAGELEGHSGAINDVSWSPDGKFLATVGVDGRLKIWELETMTLRSTFPFIEPLAVDWRSDSQYLALVDKQGAIRVIDSKGQEAGVTIDYYAATEAGINLSWNQAFSDLVAIGTDGVVRLYNYTPRSTCTNSRCPYQRIAQNLPQLSEALFSPNGNLLAVSLLGSIQVMAARDPYQLVDTYLLRNQTDAIFTSLAWNMDGTLLAAADNQGRVYQWVIRQEPPQRIQEDERWQVTEVGAVNGLAWAPNGDQIALVDVNRRLTVWNTSTLEQIGVDGQAHTDVPLAIEWNSAQSLIATGGCGPYSIIWRITVLPLRTLNVALDDSVCVTSLSFNPTGDRLITGDVAGIVRLWNWQNNQELDSRTVNRQFQINDVEWNINGDRVALVDNAGALNVYNPRNDKLIDAFARQPAPEQALTSLAWSPDGTLLATGSTSGWVAVWQLDSGLQGSDFTGSYRLEAHTSRIVSVSWSPTGNWLVSASEDGRIIVWDALTGQRLAQTLLGSTPSEVKWSPVSPPTFAVTDTGGSVSLWSFDKKGTYDD